MIQYFFVCNAYALPVVLSRERYLVSLAYCKQRRCATYIHVYAYRPIQLQIWPESWTPTLRASPWSLPTQPSWIYSSVVSALTSYSRRPTHSSFLPLLQPHRTHRKHTSFKILMLRRRSLHENARNRAVNSNPRPNFKCIQLCPAFYAVMICWTIPCYFEKQLFSAEWSEMIKDVWWDCLHGSLSSCNLQNLQALRINNHSDYFDVHLRRTMNLFISIVDLLLIYHLSSIL